MVSVKEVPALSPARCCEDDVEPFRAIVLPSFGKGVYIRPTRDTAVFQSSAKESAIARPTSTNGAEANRENNSSKVDSAKEASLPKAATTSEALNQSTTTEKAGDVGSSPGVVSDKARPAPVAAIQRDAPRTAPPSPLPSPFPQGNYMEFAPRITVIGCGGGGGNAVSNMIARNLKGVEFMVCNTDAQHLSTTLTDNRLQLGGQEMANGLGCGANPDLGRQAALESKSDILEMVDGSNMVFIAAGMGGGTGTGATPVIAEACMDAGILTVAVVTMPFSFEGSHRMRLAEEGIQNLRKTVDTLIVVPNQKLFNLVDAKTSLVEAFRMGDDVLLAGVRSVTDLMVNPGMINLDFADVRAVMAGMGNAIMGSGEADGEGRAERAAADALSNPLLGDKSMKTAKGVLVNITGGSDVTLFEVGQAAEKITEEVEDHTANIIFGSTYDSALEGSIRVSVVATGIEG